MLCDGGGANGMLNGLCALCLLVAQSQLAYVLEVPPQPGEVQKLFNILKEERITMQVRRLCEEIAVPLGVTLYVCR
jgi:hypothetical protein